MAIEDYFKGSSQAYGQLAGSLLAGRRKEDKETLNGMIKKGRLLPPR